MTRLELPPPPWKARVFLWWFRQGYWVRGTLRFVVWLALALALGLSWARCER